MSSPGSQRTPADEAGATAVFEGAESAVEDDLFPRSQAEWQAKRTALPRKLPRNKRRAEGQLVSAAVASSRPLPPSVPAGSTKDRLGHRPACGGRPESGRPVENLGGQPGMSGVSVPWKVITVLVAVLALAGVGAAGWFGISWWSAVRGNSESAVQVRDTAVVAAKRLAVTLQTVDPSAPVHAYQAWEGIATGPLLAKLRQDESKNVDTLKQSPTRSLATPVEAALTELDSDARTATAIVALDVTQATVVNGTAGPSTVRQLRVKLSLAWADDSWKVSNSDLVNS